MDRQIKKYIIEALERAESAIATVRELIKDPRVSKAPKITKATEIKTVELPKIKIAELPKVEIVESPKVKIESLVNINDEQWPVVHIDASVETIASHLSLIGLGKQVRGSILNCQNFSDESFNKLSERLNAATYYVKSKKILCNNSGVESNSYDLIIVYDIIDHINNQYELLSNLSNMLSENGMIYVRVCPWTGANVFPPQYGHKAWAHLILSYDEMLSFGDIPTRSTNVDQTVYDNLFKQLGLSIIVKQPIQRQVPDYIMQYADRIISNNWPNTAITPPEVRKVLSTQFIDYVLLKGSLNASTN